MILQIVLHYSLSQLLHRCRRNVRVRICNDFSRAASTGVGICLAPTCSRKDRDLFMYVASLAMAPSAPVLAERSDPARSTMFSLEWRVLPSAVA